MMKLRVGQWERNGNAVHERVSPHYATCIAICDGDNRYVNATAIAALPDLLKACKDVLAALEKATEETGEILWLDNALPGVHESAMERLQNVIDDAEGRVFEDDEG